MIAAQETGKAGQWHRLWWLCARITRAESRQLECLSQFPLLTTTGALKDGKAISHTGLSKYEAAFDAFLAKIENAIRGERARAKSGDKTSTDAELF